MISEERGLQIRVLRGALIAPHGGTLVDPFISAGRAKELKTQAKEWQSWDLTDRQICDLELIVNGGFSPLTGFMNSED